MLKTLIKSSSRVHGAPFTLASLVAIVVIGFALFSGRVPPLLANNGQAAALPTCEDAGGGIFIPAQINIPVLNSRIVDNTGVPQTAAISDSLFIFRGPKPALTGTVEGQGSFDYQRIISGSDPILTYPLRGVVSLSNSWDMAVTGTLDSITPTQLDFIRSFSQSHIDFTEDFSEALISTYENSTHPISGARSIADPNTALVESFGTGYTSFLDFALNGEVADHQVIVTVTRDSTVTVDDENFAITDTIPTLDSPALVDYFFSVVGNEIINGSFTMPASNFVYSNDLANVLINVDLVDQQEVISATCNYLNSNAITPTLTSLGANPVAVMGGKLNEQSPASPQYTLTVPSNTDKLVVVPQALNPNFGLISVTDPTGKVLVQSTYAQIAQPLVIPTMLSGTHGVQVKQFSGEQQYAIVAAIVPTTVVSTQTDLVLDVSDSSDPATVGDVLTYSINMLNTGNLTASKARLVQTIDPNANFILTDTIPSQGACQNQAFSVECRLGNVGISTTVQVLVIGIPTQPGEIRTQVRAGSDEQDGNPDDNTAVERTLVVSNATDADLQVSKNSLPNPVIVFQPLTYDMDIINNGPFTASDAKLTDRLPSGISVMGASTSNGSCNVNFVRNIVRCNLGDLGAKDTANVIIQALPVQTGLITNTVRVMSDENDPKNGNNLDREVTNVVDGPSPTPSPTP